MKKIAKGIWNQIQRRIEETNKNIRDSKEYREYQGPVTIELKAIAKKIEDNEKIVETYRKWNEELVQRIREKSGSPKVYEWDSYQNIISRIERDEKREQFSLLPDLSYNKIDEIAAELELLQLQYGEIPADIIEQGNYESQEPDQLMTGLVNYFQNKLV